MISNRVEVKIAGGLDFPLNKMVRIQQHFDDKKIEDIESTIKEEFKQVSVRAKVVLGQEVAIGCGSRGVANYAKITKAVIQELIKLGAKPFIFPCMGSHGAATAQGQKQVLASYGICEKEMGVPIRATMDTKIVGKLEDGTPVHMDANAADADGIVVINRIKPHTAFRGSTESGLTKMLAIGIGKINGAAAYHQHGMDNFPAILPEVRDVNIRERNVLFGVGVVENAFDETAMIQVIPSDQIAKREPTLLRYAKENMPELKFDNIDVLIIDEIGKNISGAGFDPNITGRNRRGVEWNHRLNIKKIVALGLTKASQGNATGIGGADVTTMRLYKDINIGATYANVITSMNLDGAAIPIIMNTDREAIALAIKTVVRTQPEQCRVVRIKNTLSLGEIEVSQNMLEGVRDNPKLFSIVSEPKDWNFDSRNAIEPFE